MIASLMKYRVIPERDSSLARASDIPHLVGNSEKLRAATGGRRASRWNRLCNRCSMPKRTDLSSILLIGSGPIVIGQGAEFDYSGTQAVRALKEEGTGSSW
jgi:hypothetical protein